ncbi:endo-1,4-beta-xylanase A [Clostridiales bacterium]|nr:endo-1,4-beta-xylanase A [Clostridiales bacterium]
MKKITCFFVSAIISASTAFTSLAADIPFVDIDSSSWYYSYISDVYDKGIISGTSENTFGPDVPLTRAMAATIIYRIYGSPDIEYSNQFSDIEPDQWYSDGVLWAKQIGAVSGYEDGTFCPEWSITVEQLASILYRLERVTQAEESSDSLASYSDSFLVSPYATDAVKWAAKNNMLHGDTLHPNTAATRAEAAKMLSVFTTINDFAIVKNKGAILSYITKNYDSTFDMADYTFSRHEHDSDIFVTYMVNGFRSTFRYKAVMSGDKLLRVEMIGKINPYLASTDLPVPTITDEELLKMAVEADNIEADIDSQTITKYFDMDNLKYVFEVETTYIQNENYFTKAYKYEC